MSTRTSLASASRASVVVIALATLVAAGCGSSAKVSAPPAAKKLLLAKSGTKAAGAAAEAPGPISLRPQSYVLDGTLPDLGTSATVYRWTAHAASTDDVSRLAAAFGIDATATTTTAPDGFEVSDGNATLDVTTDGGTTAVSYSLGGPATSGSSSGSSGGSAGSNGVSTGPSTGPNSPVTVEPPTDLPVPPVVEPLTTLPAKLAPVDVPSAAQAESTAARPPRPRRRARGRAVELGGDRLGRHRDLVRRRPGVQRPTG